MGLVAYIREALSNLSTAKLRSLLAILGILVGTASVVALITSSQLAVENALAQFKSLGTNLLAMDLQGSSDDSSPSDQQQRQLKSSDIRQIVNHVHPVVLVAPYIYNYQQIYFKGKQFNGQVLGATAELADIVKIKTAQGRFVSYLDRNSFYCVIGNDIAHDFYKNGVANPIGKQIQVGNWLFTIIGVAKPWEPNWFLFADINKGLIVPLQTSYLLSKYSKINNVLFRLAPQSDIKYAQDQIKDQIKKILPQQKVNFRNPEQIIDIIKKQEATFTWLLGSIGGISLLVGGIGVMNIMLVSVIERRREIGIRMAIGARRSDIRRLFLIESVILTLLGGVLGIITGVSISYILTVITGWGFHLLFVPPILGFVVSVLVGIISGLYPAHRASRLDPIETLRGE